MKTPIQELIAKLEEQYREYTSHKGNDDWYTSVAYGIEISIRHAKSMLEKERERIIEFGWYIADDASLRFAPNEHEYERQEIEEMFDKTFNTDNK
jgi:hypothetical protein